MNKKITIVSVVILVFVAGGVFLWQKSQKDVEELNKNLPEGVRVVKSLLGENYKVVNKIDGYEFKVPKEWKGVKEIEYTPERTETGYTGASINMEGIEGVGKVIAIDRYKSGRNLDDDLELWAQTNFEIFGLEGSFTKDKIKNFDIIKTQENIHLGGDYIYFFRKERIIYAITSPSEEFIRDIISNGKW